MHYVYAGGLKDGQPAFDDAVLDVYYHRTATLDRATNQTTYGDWTWDQSQGDSSTPGYHVVSGKWTNLPQSWATVTADVPSIKGYHADLGQNDPTNTNHVPANTWVFPTYNNAGGAGSIAYLDGQGYEVGPTHTIKYVPNQTTVTVNYVDDDNKGVAVGSQHWDGTTGQHIDLTLIPPANYVLTPGWVNPSSYDFDGVNSSWYTVHVKHATQDVTDQQPKDRVTKVTRLTRNHLYGDGPHKGEKFAEPDIFDVAWKRTATKDLVTGKVTFGDWQVNWDDSKSVQGQLTARPTPYMEIDGMLYPGKNGYSCLGKNSHSEFVRADGSVVVNGQIKYGWKGVDAELGPYPVLNYYYGRDQVKIPVYYFDADTGQQVAQKINDEALTGDDFRDGNTVTIDQSKLTSLPTTLTGYQLLPGQTLPTSYKIDTFAGVKGIKVQVVKDRSIKVSFVDDDAGGAIVGTPITITGHTGGDPVALNLTVPDKYQLVDGQQLPTTYTFEKGSGNVTIHLKHQVVQREAIVDVQLGLDISVRMTRGNSHRSPNYVGVATQTQWLQFKDEIESEFHDGSSFITVPSSKVGTLTGHVDYDLVNNRVVSLKDDWTTLNLGGQTYQLPNGTDVVNGVMIGSNDGKSLKESFLKSFPNADLDYFNRSWHGYLSANATSNPQSPGLGYLLSLGLQAGLVGDEPNALAKATGDRAATAVEMADKTIDSSLLQNLNFSEQNGQLQAKVNLPVASAYIPYVEKTATRTIEVTTPDGKITTIKQTATLAKEIDFQDDAHPAWTTGEWANYNAPTIPGYTPSQSQVAPVTVDGDTTDQTVKITYTANKQSTTVVYQDQNGTSMHITTVNGQTGQTVKVPNEVPTGWQIVNGEVPSEITFGPDGAPKTVVTIDHSHVTVTPDQPRTNGTKLPDNPAKTFTGVEASDLNKTITRTIKVTTPDGQAKTVTQTAKLTRTADVDEVTGEVKYSDWSTGQWDAYEVPAVPGYTASQTSVAVTPVDGNTKDQMIDVSYTANSQTTYVNYVDDAGKTVHTTTVTGKTGETVKVPSEVPAGWKLVDGQTVPNEITFGANGHEPVTVKIEHQVKSTQEQKTITRTINYVDAKGAQLKPAIVQMLSFARTGMQDLVTNAITWNSTPAQSFAAVNDLAILGYKPDITTVPAVTVNWDDQDSVVDVHYQVANSTVTIKLVDAQGHVIATTPVTGQVGSTVDLVVQVPDGWVAYNADIPARVVIGSRPTELDYLIAHRLAFVRSTDGVKAGDLIPGTKTKTFNDQVNADNLVTHASYTVNIWADEAHTRKLATKTYRTDFIRNAVVDAVTGEVYYYSWSEGGKHVFAGFTRPAGDGYQAVVVPAWTATQADPTKTVDLVAQPQQTSGTIQYQTADGTVVSRQTFMGNNAVTLTAPEGYILMTDDAAVMPTLDKNQTYVVYVRPVQTLYTATDKLPEGMESLSKTLTRTIRITEANGHVRTITQRVRFTRTATVKADGSIVYSAWRATGRAAWNKVFLPKRHGYHLVVDGLVGKTDVTENMRDALVDVKYVKD